MYDLVVVSLNPSIDLICGLLNPLKINSLNVANTQKLVAAGKGVNVAKILSNMNQKSILTGVLGKYNQDLFLNLFNEFNINHDFFLDNSATRTNIKLFSVGASTATEINSHNEYPEECFNQFIEKYRSVLEGKDVLFTGSLPRFFPKNSYAILLKEINIKNIYLDIDGALLKDIVYDCSVRFIKPNLEEFQNLVGKSLNSTDEIVEALKEFITFSKVENMVVSRGKDGSIFYLNGEIFQVSNKLNFEVVDTTGAGDSMVSGALGAFVNNLKSEDFITLSTGLSLQAISQVGVGFDSNFTNLDEMLNYIKNKFASCIIIKKF